MAGISKYALVREQLAKRLATMSPGDQLPTESELCEEFAVSRITVRRAVDDLAQDGLVIREQGRGTFVADRTATQEIRETFQNEVAGFFREQTAHGRKVTTQVLGNRIVINSQAAQILGLPLTEELIELERLRYVNGTLHQHVATYLSARQFPAILTQDFSYGSLFDFLESRYGVQLTRNDLLVRIDTAGSALSHQLSVPVDTPILAIESTVFADTNAPIAYGIASHTPKNSSIAISLRSQ